MSSIEHRSRPIRVGRDRRGLARAGVGGLHRRDGRLVAAAHALDRGVRGRGARTARPRARRRRRDLRADRRASAATGPGSTAGSRRTGSPTPGTSTPRTRRPSVRRRAVAHEERGQRPLLQHRRRRDLVRDGGVGRPPLGRRAADRTHRARASAAADPRPRDRRQRLRLRARAAPRAARLANER